MKQFLVFAGSNFYPNGGWSDYKGDFDSIENALRYLVKSHSEWEWYQIVNSETKEIIEATDKDGQ